MIKTKHCLLLCLSLILITFSSYIQLYLGSKINIVSNISPIVLIAIIFLILTLFRERINFKNNIIINKKIFFLIVISNLVVNFNVFPWVMGGQDQGVYVNASKHYSKNKNIFFEDKIFKKIYGNSTDVENESSLNFFFRDYMKIPGTNIYNDIGMQELRKNVGKEIIHKKFYKQEAKKIKYYKWHKFSENKLVFAQLPLFSLYLSNFIEIFGSKFLNVAMYLISTCSALLLFIICKTYNNRNIVSLLASLILICSPLTSFFFKFPNYEAFNLFLFLIFFFLLEEIFNKKNFNIVILSFLTITIFLLFNLKHSNFLYIMSFQVITFLFYFINNQPNTILRLKFLNLAVISLYILTIIIFIYYHRIYTGGHYQNLEKNFILPWYFFIFSPVLIFFFLTFLNRKLIYKIKEFFVFKSKTFNSLNYYNILIIFISLIILISLIRYYANFNNVLDFVKNINSHSLFFIMKYFLPYFILIFFLEHRLNKYTLVFYTLVFFFSLIFILKVSVKYEFYYARYFIPEIIPLILIYIFSFYKFKKKFVYLGFLFTFFYLIISIINTNKIEAKDSYNHIKNFTNEIASNDILIFHHPKKKEDNFLINRLALPISFYFQKKVYFNKKFKPRQIQVLYENFDKIYLISIDKLDYNYLDLVSQNNLYEETFIKHKYNKFQIPIGFSTHRFKYYVYSVNKEKFITFWFKNYDDLLIYPFLKNNFEITGFYPDGFWTNENLKIKKKDVHIIKNDKKDSQELLLYLNKANPDINNILNKINEIKINGVKIQKNNISYNDKIKAIIIKNIKLKEFKKLEINVKHFYPEINNDTRKLGLAVSSIILR